jgi:drug/metabolite transporter (DMT)-like permease
MLPAFLTTLLFSLSAVSANRCARLIGGTEANFWRLCWATILLGLYSQIWGIGLTGPAFSVFFLGGIVGFGLGDLALFQALPRIGSRLTILLVHCLASPMASIIEFFWLGTRLTPVQMICASTILAGVAVALAPSREPSVAARREPGWGVFFGVVAAFGQGFGAVISRKAYQVAQAAGQHTAGIGFGINAAYQRILGGVIFSGIFLLLVKRDFILRAARDPKARDTESPPKWKPVLPWLLLNGLAGPALGVSCYQWALSEQPTGVVLPIVALTPLVVIPFSYWFEGERPGKRSLAGGVLAVIGAVALKIAS